MRQGRRRGGTAVAGAAALLLGTTSPARAAEVAVRYSRFLYPSEGAAGAFHLSLAQPVGTGLDLAFDGARYPGSDGGAYRLAAGLRLSERSGNGPTLFAQVMAGAFLGPAEGGSLGMLQPGFGVDFASRGPAAIRLQVDWPLITFGGPIYLTPQLSLGVVFRPE